MSTTGYSLKGCWGFIPPFGLGLPNYPSQIPFRRRYGGYRFSRRRFPSPPTDIPFLPTEHSLLPTDIPFLPSRDLPSSPAETSSSQQRSHLPPEEYPFNPHKKGQPSRITLSNQPPSSASPSSTGCITSLITIIATITSLITSNRSCRPLHNLYSLLCKHLQTDIL